MKRQVTIILFFLVFLFTKITLAQKFTESLGMHLFNQGDYNSAIATIPDWIRSEKPSNSERGQALYFLGECYYNLAIEAVSTAEAKSLFNNAQLNFVKALKNVDFQNRYSDDFYSALYKKGWCIFRRAELAENSISFLSAAYADFNRLSKISDISDSLKILSTYMAGESKIREGVLRRYEAINNQFRDIDEVEGIISSFFYDAMQLFDKVIKNDLAQPILRICAQIKQQNIYHEIGKLYQVLPEKIFNEIIDKNKKENAASTAIWYFEKSNYQLVQNVLTEDQKSFVLPVIEYAEAMKHLNMHWISKSAAKSSHDNFDRLTGAEFERIKPFRKGNIDQASTSVDSVEFTNLCLENRNSYYFQATQGITEAYFWLGLVQYISGQERSRLNFETFISSTTENARIQTLIEEAKHKKDKLDFERFSRQNDKSNLRILLSLLESFNPQNLYINKDKERLSILVRLKLGENIGQIFAGKKDEEKLAETLVIINDLLPRAASVKGVRRREYLNMLNKLFLITQTAESEEATFYQGIAQSLEAEILSSESDMVKAFDAAFETLKSCQDTYVWEAKYIMARSLLLARKHVDNDSKKEKDLKTAEDLFRELINRKGSSRSLFYLGEIFKIKENHVAARRCFEKVYDLTNNNKDGRFWAMNARDRIRKCLNTGDLTVLRNVDLNGVRFPDNLLPISYEKLADTKYLQQQLAEKGLYLLKKYCLPKKSIYPSSHCLENSIFRSGLDFENLSAGINEIRGPVTTDLRLMVFMPQDIKDKTCEVWLGQEILLPDSSGFYNKLSIPLNTALDLKISNPSCYLFQKQFRFSNSGEDSQLVYLSKNIKYDAKGNADKNDNFYLHSRDGFDGNIIIHRSGKLVEKKSELGKNFESNIWLRDFVFWEKKFFVVDCEANEIRKYNDLGIMGGKLDFTLDGILHSPEGIALDSDGNIYIADWGNHRVVIFDSTGEFQDSLGKFGKNNNENPNQGDSIRFIFPTRIAIEEDTVGQIVTIGKDAKKVFKQKHILVADRYGVHKCDSSGFYLDSPITPQTKKGFPEGSFYGITINGYGTGSQLFVVDRDKKEIKKFIGKSRH